MSRIGALRKRHPAPSEAKVRPEFTLPDEGALRALYPPVHTLAAIKGLAALDCHAPDLIRRLPFQTIGTQNREGRANVGPRGDPDGFVTVPDDWTLAIPDRSGNNRLDTLSNILSNPNVGLLFLIPGFDVTLRVSGTARLSTDPDLLRILAVSDRLPRLAILVTVSEVFLHCAKAFRRARLWDPEARQDRTAMPTLLRMILDQTTGAPLNPAEMQKIDEGLEADYRTSMY